MSRRVRTSWPNPRATELRIAWVTLLKIAAGALAAWACVRLWKSVELLLFAALIAIALSPVVRALERRRVSRGKAVALLAPCVVVLGAAFAFFVAAASRRARCRGCGRASRPSATRSRARSRAAACPRGSSFRCSTSRTRPRWTRGSPSRSSWGPLAFEVAGAGVVVVVLSLYLILDGPKVVAWLLAYAPRAHRRRMGDMVPELFSVVQAYTTGQLISSTLFAVFAAVVLTATRVPGVLPLALLAALVRRHPRRGHHRRDRRRVPRRRSP